MSDMGFGGLRIALVGPLPPPAGGMANQTRQLAELLSQEGAHVELVQSNAPYRPACVAGLPVVRALFRLLPFLCALWRASGRNQVLHVMANSGWSWHLFAAPAIWIGSLRGRPVLVNYRGGEAESFLERSGALVGVTLRRARALLVPSGFLHALFERHGFAPLILPNVVDLQRFQPEQGQSNGGPLLIVARNLEPIYDNATALRVLAQVRRHYPEARLVIAGSGPELPRLQALAAELGLDAAVQFSGRLDRDAMADLYRAATISLNPSLADNMPNSVLESMASGVPVVSTDVGGVPFLLQAERTALLVPAGDGAAMAAAALRLLDDQVLYQRLRQAGLEEVQRYTWRSIGPKLAALYREALAKPFGRTPRNSAPHS